MNASLEYVSNTAGIADCITTFNETAPQNRERALKVMRQTSYWVLDSCTRLFAPSKFVGFSKMTFDTYESAVRGDCSGERFDGHATRSAIEAVTHTAFQPESFLDHELVKWAERLLGAGVLSGLDESRWKFLEI